MHNLSHQSVDAAHGIIVDVAVTPGNANDSEPYLKRIEYMCRHLGLKMKAAGTDSAYSGSLVCQRLNELGIRLYPPKPTGGATYRVAFKKKDFKFQKEEDCFLCPVGKKVTLRSLEREEFNICRIYRADRKDCQACPMLSQCVSKSHKSRTIRVNIFEGAVKKQRKRDGTPLHRQILKQRQIWCEGSFAAQKAHHNLSRLFRRGVEAVEEHCLLSAMALNLKRMVKCMG